MCDNHPYEYFGLFLFTTDFSYLNSCEGVVSVDTIWMIEFSFESM